MKKKLVVAILTTAAVMGTSMTAFAGFTPKYKPLSKYGYTGVPKITVTLSDGIKNAVSKSAEESVKNLDIKLLNTPVINESTYIHEEECLKVSWNSVNEATSYEIKVKKSDGSEYTYTSNSTSLIVSKGDDDFIIGCFEGTVKVRAVKNDGALYSLWTEEAVITCDSTHE